MTHVKTTKNTAITDGTDSNETKKKSKRAKKTVNHNKNIVRELTEREVDVLKLLMMGKSNTKIGEELQISSHTAKAHVCSILRKMSVNDRVQAAVKAVRENIVN